MSHLRFPTRPTLLRALAAAAIASVLAAPAAAEEVGESGPPAWAYRMPHDLMSPFCPGRTLAECPSPQADELRLWILTQAVAGASRDEIQENLYARFGDTIRSAPRAEGLGLAAYLLPIGAFLAGAVFVGFALRRLVGRRASEGASPVAAVGASDTELERIIDAELGEA